MSRPAQFPAAGNLAAKFFRIAGHRHDPRRIGAPMSKGCGKFPASEGQGIIRPAQGNVSTLAGNSQDRARNRRQRRNPDANVSCRSFFGRSFVDGANFDGKIDRIRSWLYKLRLPARFARGFFAPTLRSRKTKLPPDPIRPHQPASGMLSRRMRKRDVSGARIQPHQGYSR